MSIGLPTAWAKGGGVGFCFAFTASCTAGPWYRGDSSLVDARPCIAFPLAVPSASGARFKRACAAGDLCFFPRPRAAVLLQM